MRRLAIIPVVAVLLVVQTVLAQKPAGVAHPASRGEVATAASSGVSQPAKTPAPGGHPLNVPEIENALISLHEGSLLPGTAAFRLAEQQAQRQHHQLIPTRQLEYLPANASVALAFAGGRPPGNATEAVNRLGGIPQNATAAFTAARMFAGSPTGQSRSAPTGPVDRPAELQAGLQNKQIQAQLPAGSNLEVHRPTAAGFQASVAALRPAAAEYRISAADLRPALANFQTGVPSHPPLRASAGQPSTRQEVQRAVRVGKRKADFGR